MYTNRSKNSSSWTNVSESLFEDLVLKEDSGKLLLESGGGIILEQSTPSESSYTSPSKNSSSWTNVS